METKVAIIKDINTDIRFIEEAGKVIRNGGTVAFPTETVYGLGANALDDEAVRKIFIAKGRPQDNPLIIHVSTKEISELVKDVPEVAQKIIDKFWPGPLTVILEKKDIIPNVTSANLESVGGNIDVALISKGDGFIWKKRNPYFDPKINPQFFDEKMNKNF